MAGKNGELPNFDKGLILAAIGKNSEIQLVKGIKIELRGDKIDSRILVITSFRFYILTGKGPYKIDLSIHILDIHTIESQKPEQIVVQYGEKQVKFCIAKPGSIHVVVGQLIANLKINFPGGSLDESVRKVIEPNEKLESINNVVNKLTSSEGLTESGPCGGFSRSYSCICNHFGVPFVEEVAWDVDTIYLSNDTKEFNIHDFDHLEPRELIPIIATLEYNAWFTKLVCVSYKLSAEILDVITKVIKRSTTIVEVVLDGVSLGREFCQKLATALTSNPKSALERIDLSRNPSAEDRGITHLVGGFSKLSHGLDSLILHETGITSKGASTISQMLRSSKYMSTSLTRLNLSNNPIKADGVTAICDFLAQANALTHVDLSSTECSVENIFGALIRGCCQNLAYLNLSANQFTNRRSKDTNLSSSYRQFFSSTAALKEIKMSDCRLPADAARALFLGLIENNVVKEVTVDISKNELKAAGLRAITGPLSQIKNLYSIDLSENGFESDLIPLCESLCENKNLKKIYLGQNCHKGRNLNNIMEALIKLISVENSPIEFLSLAESRLKQSVTLLFDSLGTNESLVELDITGNLMGDEGARVLAKALQINSKLRTIHWDRNNVTQNGFRDIALALENNLTLQSMPIPINDVTLCLKPATEKALKQIEKCLSRNHSPSQAVTEQAYRLQQGLMMTSTQQQMVDKLIVQLQDTARILRGSSDETVKTTLRNALRCINDADKLKQLFLNFHMSTSSRNLDERLSSLASDIYNSIQKQMKENVNMILECAESNLPFVTKQQGVKENLKTACEGKENVSKAFIDTVLLQKLAPLIMNEVSEKSLNLSTVVVDTLMDECISQLEQQQVKLDLLVKERQQGVKEKSGETDEHNDNISEAAQKAKNRLSAVVNRRSRLLDDESEVFSAPSHHKRRPTVSRKRKTSAEDHADAPHVEDTMKKEAPVPDINLSLPVESVPKELVHVTKNRARPARGRRPPTRVSGGQQNSVAGPEIVVENFDTGIDSFFDNKPARPQSAALPTHAVIVTEPALPKSASVSQRLQGNKKKHDKEDAEDNHKEPQEKKKHGILGGLGLFKKKGEKKSPAVPRKESKKDNHKNKSQEDLADSGPPPEKRPEPKPEPTHVKPAPKSVEEPAPKPVEKPASKPASVKQPPKRPPNRPQKPDKAVSAEVGKPAEPETKPETTKASDEPPKEKTAEAKNKEKDKEDESKHEGGREKTEGEEKKEEEEPKKEEEGEKMKPKRPPKFGVGLPMGSVGGDLLAEMKKRNEGKKASPELQARPRVGTNPDMHRPVVPVRPSSMKRSVQSAVDLNSVTAQEEKPAPSSRTKEDDKDKRRLSNEAIKPVPPKPAPKEKPHVAGRPAVPKRPPSISRNRGSSLTETAEKRKNSEADTAAAETKPIDEILEQPAAAKDENTETKQDRQKQRVEDDVFNNHNQPEKTEAELGKDLGDKTRTEEKPKKAETEKYDEIVPLGKPKTEEKPGDETPAPGKDANSKDETADKEDSGPLKASTLDTTKPANDSEAKETPDTKSGGDKTTKSDDVPAKPKDTNDNETETTVAFEEPTKTEDSAAKPECDDVIKSAVDEELLNEVLDSSSKDTSF